MKLSEIDPRELTAEIAEKLIYGADTEDTGHSGDAAIVLGSRKAVKYRVPKAVQAYRQGRIPLLVMTGGVIHEGESVPEAARMTEAAVNMGVPRMNILEETRSGVTTENIVCALTELQRNVGLENIRSLLIVTARYHMKRSLLTARRYVPEYIALYPCTAEMSQEDEAKYRLRAYGEAERMLQYAALHTIADCDTEL